jgi:hypothetical protein
VVTETTIEAGVLSEEEDTRSQAEPESVWTFVE